MTISDEQKLGILEQMSQMIAQNWRFSSKIAQATAALTKLKLVWRYSNIPLYGVLPYNFHILHTCESWTLAVELEKRTKVRPLT